MRKRLLSILAVLANLIWQHRPNIPIIPPRKRSPRMKREAPVTEDEA